jgi:hypothetical protein
LETREIIAVFGDVAAHDGCPLLAGRSINLEK